MANIIQHRRSISGGAVPSAGQLVNTGELFVNTADEKLYVSKGGGTAFVLSPGGGGGTLTVQDEGSTTSTTVTTLNFTGAGVTASGAGATATINIASGGSGGGLTQSQVLARQYF